MAKKKTKKKTREQSRQSLLHHIYDLIFKVFFGDPIIAQKFLEHFMPETVFRRLDFSHFQKRSTAHVSGRFGVSYTDVVYETRLRGSNRHTRVVILFEHKSTQPNLPVYFQLFDYLLQLWEEDMRQGRPYAIVIPIIFYHGERPWKQEEIFDLLDLPEEFWQYIPFFKYEVFDLSTVPIEVIERKQDIEYLGVLLLALKFARQWEQLAQHMPAVLWFIHSRSLGNREAMLLQSFFIYIENLLKMNSVKISQFTEKIPNDSQEAFETLVRVYGPMAVEWQLESERQEGFEAGLREGREEGRLEGREEGRLEAMQMLVEALMLSCPEWSDVEIAQRLGVPEELVRQVRQQRHAHNANGNDEKS